MAKSKSTAAGGNLVGSFILAYLVSFLLIGSLIYSANVWNFLGNSRLLDLLIRGGVVQYHDTQAGFIAGIPDTKYFLMSQDPIGWQLVIMAILLLTLYWAMKALQFHGITRLCGVGGGYGEHARAYFFGVGLNKLVPYNAGAVGSALALEGFGASRPQATSAAFISRGFTIFEIVFYATIGLLVLGWATWLGQIFWALVIAGILYLFLRRSTGQSGEDAWGSFGAIRQAVLSTTQHPGLFVKLAFLSLVCFALEHVAVYATAMAFTSKYVLLNVEFEVLLMGLVAGYIARMVPLTPGGWGQFEWAFATALYIGGVGFPESATLAIVFGLIRIGVALTVSGLSRLFHGVNANMSDALDVMRENPAQ